MTVDKYYLCRYCGKGVATSFEGLDRHENECYKRPETRSPYLTIPLKNKLNINLIIPLKNKLNIDDFIRV
ncbi:MAG: hypothetical protein Q8N99_09045 [Nanoarchaeota archaeon]|nr:hypothetical protein [Nanoarchaeota archaeon]